MKKSTSKLLTATDYFQFHSSRQHKARMLPDLYKNEK